MELKGFFSDIQEAAYNGDVNAFVSAHIKNGYVPSSAEIRELEKFLGLSYTRRALNYFGRTKAVKAMGKVGRFLGSNSNSLGVAGDAFDYSEADRNPMGYLNDWDAKISQGPWYNRLAYRAMAIMNTGPITAARIRMANTI